MQERCKLSGMVLFVLLFYIAFAIFLYYPTVESLIHIWFFSEHAAYKHGLLLLVVSVYLFYKSWITSKSKVVIRPEITGLVFLIMASIIWFFAQIAEIQVVQQVTFVIIIYLILWAVLGYRMSCRFAFPVLLLLCATPVWELLNEDALQLFTAKVVTAMVRLIGVNVYLENVRIFIPEGTFSVNPECSGIQQLISAVSVAAIYAYLNQFRIIYFLAYIALAAVLSLMINAVRIFIVVLSGHLTNMQHYFIQVDHGTLGWILFGIGMFIFILLSNKFLLSHYGSFIIKTDKDKRPLKSDAVILNKKYSFQLLLVVLGLSVGPLWAQIQNSKPQGDIGDLVVSEVFDQWQLSAIQNYGYRPFYVTADRIFEKNYTNKSGSEVYFHISYYRYQKQDKELISYLNHVHDKKTWIRLASHEYDLAISGLEFVVKETIVKNPQGREKLIWHWYYLAGMQTSNEKVEKLLEVWSELSNQPGASLFLAATDVNESYEASRKELHAFLSDSLAGMEMAVEKLSKPSK